MAPEIVYRRERCILCGECMDACPEDANRKAPDGIEVDSVRCVVCGTCARVCPAEARELIGRTMTSADVVAEVEKDRPYFDESGGGVTFSGGEPLAQPEFLLDLLDCSRSRAIHTAVDTSGYAEPGLFQEVAALADLVLYDLKHMDSDRHRALTGVGNELILSNLQALAGVGTAFRLRLPLIPGYNDSDENMEETARFISALGRSAEVDLLPFHRAARDKHERFGRSYSLPETSPHAPLDLAHLREIFERRGLKVGIGG